MTPQALQRPPFVMVAPTGARHGKADHPGIPLSPAEIAATARACHGVGADALHLHVRDADGVHSLDAGLYREAMAAVKEAVPGMAIQVTTEAAGRFCPEAQFAALDALSPRWASVSLRELGTAPDVARRFYALARDREIALQHIIYDGADADRLAALQAEGVLGLEESVILVLGRYGVDQQSRLEDLAPLHAALPPVGRWMLCAFGRQEHACLHAAASMGGDVRVGFENALTDANGTPWPSMEASVAALTHPWRQAA